MRVEWRVFEDEYKVNFKIHSIKIRKIIDGMWYLYVEFDEPKYFLVSSGYLIDKTGNFIYYTIIPDDDKNTDILEMILIPETDEEKQIFNDGVHTITQFNGRYTFDSVIISYKLLDKLLTDEYDD